MPVVTREALRSPDWLPVTVDTVLPPIAGKAVVCPVIRSDYRKPFLGREYIDQSDALEVYVVDLPPFEQQALCKKWIFHSALCGSTFLTRCLEIETTLVLREPPVFWSVLDSDRRINTKGLRIAATMCGRTYSSDQVAIVKTQPLAMTAIAELTGLSPDIRVVILMPPIEYHLIAHLKHSRRRQYTRKCEQAIKQLADIEELQLPERMTDAQVAAAGWVLQDRAASRVAGSDQVIRLNSRNLFDSPVEVTARVADFFRLDTRAVELRTEEAMSTEAKTGDPFDRRDYDERLQSRMRGPLQEEVEAAVEWVDGLNA